MSSYPPQIDDPEKHYLGNLLSDQEDSFVQQSANSTAASSSREQERRSIAPAPGGAVGSSHGSHFWPEPPPPYSPPSGLSAWSPASAFSSILTNKVIPDNAREPEDWDAYLYSNPVTAQLRHELEKQQTAPSSAPVHSNHSLPFSYRDVATRNVSSYSLGSSRHGSGSSPPKDEERQRLADSVHSDRNNLDNLDSAINHHKNKKDETDFKQITRKKGSAPVKNQPQTVKEAKSSRAVSAAELAESPPLEDISRFHILEKLPARMSGVGNSETSISVQGPTPVTARVEQRRGNGGRGVSASGGAGRSKKNNRRDNGRRAHPNVHYHLVELLMYIRLGLAWLAVTAQRVVTFVVELFIDVSLKVCALAKYGAEQTCGRARCVLHDIRARAVHWWRTEKKSNEFDGNGLTHNINLPDTPEQALDRLISARGRDAYTVLGLRQDATDDEIRTYYKKQALLVHPDKNDTEGAAEAFQILSKAFEVIGTPEARNKYNFENFNTSVQHKEIAELYMKLRQKVEEARNRMECDCGGIHVRVPTKLSQQAARFCRKCATRHPSKNADIWAESKMFGLVWVYYTCVNGVVYDITSWANCKSNQLKYLKPDSHTVTYRLLSQNSNKEARSAADRYLKMLSDGLEKASQTINVTGNSHASLQPLDREDDRPRRAKRAPKRK